MKNWWNFGEGIGTCGNELATHHISCPFCGSKGQYTLEHHSEMTHNERNKTLNFDTLRCRDCAGFTLVFWSASYRRRGGQHAFINVPWLSWLPRASDHWPAEIHNFWMQAYKSLNDAHWDDAGMMARSALQVITRDQNAVGENLKQELEDLGRKGVLPPIMIAFSTEIRLLGNTTAQTDVDPQDARDIVKFLALAMDYIYNLPKQITDYRQKLIHTSY